MSTGGLFSSLQANEFGLFWKLGGRYMFDIPCYRTFFLISKIKNEVDHHESTTSHVSLQVAKGEEVFESFVKLPSDVQV